MSKKGKNSKLPEISAFLITMGILFGLGIFLGAYGANNELPLLYDLIILYVSLFIAIAIHEAGHLVFGYLSGYEFISFRIGSLTLIKEDKRFKLKNFSIVGTAGQCLMMPKIDKYEEVPYFLYNLGGILFNITATIIACLVFIIFDVSPLIDIFLKSFSIVNIFLAISNGIPVKIGGFPNDGYNLLNLSKDSNSREGFAKQLILVGKLNKGERLKDMPIELFYVEESANLDNPLITATKINEVNYYLDKHDFKKGKELLLSLLENAPNMISIFRKEVNCELLFCAILENDKDNIDKLYTKELQKYIKASKHHINKKRLQYAYSLIIERDENKSLKLLNEFEKIAKKHPSKGDVESEREIVKYIQENINTIVM